MDARALSLQILLSVFEQKHSLTQALEQHLAKAKANDRGFIQECCYGVCRWYDFLDGIALQCLKKPLKAKDADIYLSILLGLYQCHFMRLPDHAAVNKTVALAKARKKPWASGLMNAVLRTFLRDKTALIAKLDQTPAAKSAHPQWLYDRISQAWPAQLEQILEANNQYPPMHIRLNTEQLARAAWLETFEGEATCSAAVPTGIQLQQAVPVERLPGFKKGQVFIQDLAAQLAAPLLDAQAGDRVLDVCAAPGGKTCHILQATEGLDRLVAIDISAARLEKVRENLERASLQAELICADACDVAAYSDGEHFDRILLDAPCSATGVIRRHPDIKQLRFDSDIDALVALQAQILQSIWPLLKPGGVLLYATCSILPEENTKQLSHFLAEHADAEEWPIEAEWGMPAAVGRQILPGMAAMDGFYYGRLRKLPIE